MTTSGDFRRVPMDSIWVDRENRQRREVGGISDLADSISRIGLLHPLVIERTDHRLLSGERRFEALKSLGWTEAPVQYADELDDTTRRIIELEENLRRVNLHWKEDVYATAAIHNLFCEMDEGWGQEDTARRLGFERSSVTQRLAIWRELEKGNERVASADGIRAANNVVNRDYQRAVENELSQLNDVTAEVSHRELDEDEVASVEASDDGEALPAVSSTTRTRNSARDIICADFVEWAASYSGRRFNILHCDFPYGIDHGKSAQGGSKRWGAYADSPDVYWRLCAALAENLDRILYPSAHVIFWFSMSYYTETVEFFSRAAPSLDIQPMPLVWHKSDNKGIVSDVERRPRHTYETALLMARGDRKIIQPVADSYPAPTNKSAAFHISEKPEPVLKHFFRMIVDDMAEVLDPTCGSGSALRAAEALRAKRVHGLEIDAEMRESAVAELRRSRNLRAAEDLV